MHRYAPIIIALAAAPPPLSAAVPPIYNCTETFDHNNTLTELVDQLRDDDIRRNLTRALPVLLSHPQLTTEFLYQQLNHEDWQVRQIICESIWARAFPPPARRAYQAYFQQHLDAPTEAYDKLDPAYPITETLIRVTIEGLRHDTTPYDRPRRRGLCYSNALLGLRVLSIVAHDWSSLLIEAMDSDDPQQRILAASILGFAGVDDAAEKAAAILLPHLRDNSIGEDAKFCLAPLAAFGEAILPHLSAALPAADQQQRDLILLLIQNIKAPAQTEQQRRANARLNSITETVHDPVATPAPSPMHWFNQLYRD